MKFFENQNNNKPKLFIFYLGGKIDKCNIEIHDVVFVIGQSDIEIANKVKEKWIGNPKSFHIDSWFMIENIDGFEIEVNQGKIKPTPNSLFFVNLGYYLQDNFGESHFMTLTVAKSRAEAIKAARNKLFANHQMLHTDNIYDIDECIKLEQISNYYISLKYTGNAKPNVINNGYQKLSY
ncbi:MULTISPECIES: DUF1543 domain-containing protein [unclassified Rickettsia]|uniref:DUF1543 domain-containing protein n=1 Tax=unclassified Rickettsia TaxID=114295 RepID=UPI00313340B5